MSWFSRSPVFVTAVLDCLISVQAININVSDLSCSRPIYFPRILIHELVGVCVYFVRIKNVLAHSCLPPPLFLLNSEISLLLFPLTACDMILTRVEHVLVCALPEKKRQGSPITHYLINPNSSPPSHCLGPPINHQSVYTNELLTYHSNYPFRPANNDSSASHFQFPSMLESN
ncbi:hypothetical protein M5689_016181 [Euphorbia peplus]|nr:hypothetical protein M5689_016181 [Euphorbia peplus]